jgi:hypothetical protein
LELRARVGEKAASPSGQGSVDVTHRWKVVA